MPECDRCENERETTTLYRDGHVWGRFCIECHDEIAEFAASAEAIADGGEPVDDTVRYGYSRLTDTWYRVTEWEDAGDGKIKAISKEEVPRDEVPAAWLQATEERAYTDRSDDDDLVTDGGPESPDDPTVAESLQAIEKECEFNAVCRQTAVTYGEDGTALCEYHAGGLLTGGERDAE